MAFAFFRPDVDFLIQLIENWNIDILCKELQFLVGVRPSFLALKSNQSCSPTLSFLCYAYLLHTAFSRLVVFLFWALIRLPTLQQDMFKFPVAVSTAKLFYHYSSQTIHSCTHPYQPRANDLRSQKPRSATQTQQETRTIPFRKRMIWSNLMRRLRIADPDNERDAFSSISYLQRNVV